MVQWDKPRFTKDGRMKAPRHLLVLQRTRFVPLPIYIGIVAGAVLFAKRQYDEFVKVTPQQKFLRKIEVQPYGVLGTKMKSTKMFAQAAKEPDDDTVIVDPAGLHHIKGVASDAGGAAKAIYNWLGLTGKFPEPVVNSIHRPCDAKFHSYDGKKVIHCVGPDFREGTWSKREAVLELSKAYRNVFHEFVMSETKVLRVPPISGGIFAGTMKDFMPPLTHEAVCLGFQQLHPFDQEAVNSDQRRIELCIFSEDDWTLYVNAFDHLDPPNPVVRD